MAKILLDYVFPISVITPTPAASTAFLKKVCLVVQPKTGQEGNVGQFFTCTNMTQVGVRTDNLNAQQLFNAGMSSIILLLADNLDLEEFLDANAGEFYTLLISDDFTDSDVEEGIVTAGVKASLKVQDILYTAVDEGAAGNEISIEYVDDGTAGAETVDVGESQITVHMEAGVSTAQQIADAIEADGPASAFVTVLVDVGDESDVQAAAAATFLAGGVTEVAGGDGLTLGSFKGVVGVSSTDLEFLADQAVIPNRCAFFTKAGNDAKNMCFAFGTLLSSTNWSNQQYIAMPFNDDVDELGNAESLFEQRISFVIHDDEFGNRLAFLCAGGKAIIAPYILKNLRVDMQSRALQWISQNKPQYTLKEAALLETRLQEDVINSYIARSLIVSGSVEITLVEQNFQANGAIEVPEPKALWRVVSEMVETV